LTEQEILLEARFSAIEYLVSHLLVLHYRTHQVGSEALDTYDAQANTVIEGFTIPALEPAMADHFTDEMGQHITRMLKSAREMYGK
jgi:hypothetical protein